MSSIYYNNQFVEAIFKVIQSSVEAPVNVQARVGPKFSCNLSQSYN